MSAAKEISLPRRHKCEARARMKASEAYQSERSRHPERERGATQQKKNDRSAIFKNQKRKQAENLFTDARVFGVSLLCFTLLILELAYVCEM